MNPYYKYPLLIAFALVIIGLAFLVYKNLPEDVAEKVSELAEPVAQEDAKSGTGAQGATSAATTEPTANAGTATTHETDSAGQLLSSRRFQTLLKAARLKLAQTDLLGARKLAEEALKQPEAVTYSPAWREAADIVSHVNTQLINSDAPAPEKVRYEVKPGDNLVKIARAHNTTVEGLIRGNNNLDKSSSTIFPGMVFKIFTGNWSLEASKTHFMLVLHNGDRLFKVYDVAIGKEGRTPVGTFTVKDKLREPAWTPPGKNIPYGDPENVLGTRWLGLKPTGGTDSTLRGYGIHGTWEPKSIGSAASQGCLRMLNSDVEELFDIVPLGTPVTIKD